MDNLDTHDIAGLIGSALRFMAALVNAYSARVQARRSHK